MKKLTDFLSEIANLCDQSSRPSLSVPLQSVGTAAFPQLMRLQQGRITHASHPLRVLRHLLVALVEEPDITPAVELALGISCLGHDLSAVKKISSTTVKKQRVTGGSGGRRRNEKEESRRLLRLLHEVDGATELIGAVMAANELLGEEGHLPIGSEALEIAVRMCSVHDAPSLRSRLPLRPDSPAGHGLAIFVQADGLAMIEFHDKGLKSQTPVGPLVECWVRMEPVDPKRSLHRRRGSVKSLRTRLIAAFGLGADTPLQDCFSNRALGQLADQYLSAWQAELDLNLRDLAGAPYTVA